MEQTPHTLKSRYGDLFWLLVLGTLWGFSYLFIKVVVSAVPPFTLVTGRLLISTLILWFLLRLTRQDMPRNWKLWGAFAVMGSLSGAVPWSLITWGEQYISSGLAALLQATTPIFTLILASLLSHDEQLSLTKALGVIVGFVGVGILLLPDLRQGLQASLLGQLAIVLSSVSYATATVFARRWLGGQPPLVSTTGQLTTGLLFMLPIALIVDRAPTLSLSLPVIGSWLALSVLGTAVAYILYYALLARTGATFVSTVTYIIPVNGLILGALILHEPLTTTVLISLGLILVSVLLVRGAFQRPAPKAAS